MRQSVPRSRYLSLASNAINTNDWTLLTNLRTLTFIDLHSNRLWGTLPSALSRLSGAFYLDISSNMLTGSVPSQLSNLTSLRCGFAYEGEFGVQPPSPRCLIREFLTACSGASFTATVAQCDEFLCREQPIVRHCAVQGSHSISS